MKRTGYELSRPSSLMPARTIRTAELSDVPAMQDVFRSAVLRTAAAHYDADQRRVWAARAEDADRWQRTIREQQVLVTVDGERVVGFISLTPAGHIDLLHVHADHGRQGVAQALFEALVREAQKRGIQALTTDVSHTARPFFERQGFRAVRTNRRELDGVVLENFRMELVL